MSYHEHCTYLSEEGDDGRGCACRAHTDTISPLIGSMTHGTAQTPLHGRSTRQTRATAPSVPSMMSTGITLGSSFCSSRFRMCGGEQQTTAALVR